MSKQLDSFSTFASRRGLLQKLRVGLSVILRDGLGSYAADIRVIPAEGLLVLGGEGPEGLSGPEIRIEFADVSVLAVDTVCGERCLRLDTILGDQFYLSPMDRSASPSVDEIAETLSKLIEHSGGTQQSSTSFSSILPPHQHRHNESHQLVVENGDISSTLTVNNSGDIAAELRNLYALLEEKNRVVAQLADAVTSLQQSFQYHISSSSMVVGTHPPVVDHQRPSTAAHLAAGSSQDANSSPMEYDLEVHETENMDEVIDGGGLVGGGEEEGSRVQRQRPLTAGGILRHPSTLVVSFEGELHGNGPDSLATSHSSDDVGGRESVQHALHVDPMTVVGPIPEHRVPREGNERRNQGHFVGSRRQQPQHRTQQHRPSEEDTHSGSSERPSGARPCEGGRPRRGPGIGDLGDDVLERVREAAMMGGGSGAGNDDVDNELVAAYRDINGDSSTDSDTG